jgi:hypothetical protein
MSVGAEEGACLGDVERRRRKPQLVCAMSGSAHLDFQGFLRRLIRSYPEPLGAITAESDRCLRKVEQVREHVQGEMGGAEVQHELPRHHILSRRPVLGERLHRRLDAPQTPDVGERRGNGATLGSVELARRRAAWRAGRCRRGTMPAAAVAAGRHEPEYGNGVRESPRRRRRGSRARGDEMVPEAHRRAPFHRHPPSTGERWIGFSLFAALVLRFPHAIDRRFAQRCWGWMKAHADGPWTSRT